MAFKFTFTAQQVVDMAGFLYYANEIIEDAAWDELRKNNPADYDRIVYGYGREDSDIIIKTVPGGMLGTVVEVTILDPNDPEDWEVFESQPVYTASFSMFELMTMKTGAESLEKRLCDLAFKQLRTEMPGLYAEIFNNWEWQAKAELPNGGDGVAEDLVIVVTIRGVKRYPIKRSE